MVDSPRRAAAGGYRTILFLLVVAALGVAAPRATAAGRPVAGAGAPPGSGAVSVTVDQTRTTATLPADFTGLSFEATELHAGAAHWNPARGNFVALVRTLGTGQLRFGGNAVDRHAAWTPDGGALPPWASVGVTRTDLAKVAAFSAATGWPVLLGVNLGHFDAASAADQAGAAATAFGSRLNAIECGNEPNVYHNDLRPPTYTYAQYRTEWEACARAVAGAGRLAGPDTIGTGWTPGFVADEHTRIGLVTQHFYALSGCGANKGTATVPALLSPATAATATARLADVTTATRPLGLPVRMGETNSVSCSGQKGVSDVYAAALWGLDYMLSMAQHGAAGVNFHTGLGSCSGYAVLCTTASPTTNVLSPQPLYYGMLMFHLMGTGKLLPVTVAAGGANVTGYAVQGPDGHTRVMLVDKDATGGTASVTVHAGTGSGVARVLRLTGSALTSAAKITIQGARVDASGQFTPGPAESVTGTAGTYTVQVPTGSAALLTLP